VAQQGSSATLTLDPDKDSLQKEAKPLAELLRAPERSATLIGPRGEKIELPAPIFDALALIAEALLRGNGVSVIPLHHLLTTNEAAELVNVSRPYLVRLLKEKKIPYEMVGTHRRVRLGDVLTFRQQREEQRHDALQNLVRQSEKLGLPY
jgi:excisionase family DNA binding protein